MLLVVGPYKFHADTAGQIRITSDMPDGPPQSLMVEQQHVADFWRFVGMCERLYEWRGVANYRIRRDEATEATEAPTPPPFLVPPPIEPPGAVPPPIGTERTEPVPNPPPPR